VFVVVVVVVVVSAVDDDDMMMGDKQLGLGVRNLVWKQHKREYKFCSKHYSDKTCFG
jgi:hypothetical protein